MVIMIQIGIMTQAIVRFDTDIDLKPQEIWLCKFNIDRSNSTQTNMKIGLTYVQERSRSADPQLQLAGIDQ